jgi:hypothetical protein
MSNTCFNTLLLSGPNTDRERFSAEVGANEPSYDFFAVHVPVLEGDHPTDYWGTKGIKDVWRDVHDAERTEYYIRTAWGPPWRWFEQLAPLFPGLRLELFFGSIEGAFGGYMLAEGGRVVTFDHVEGRFTDFFAERGRPGFFIPYWENDELLAEEAAEEAMGEILEAGRWEEAEEWLPSIGEVECPPDPHARHPERGLEVGPSLAELAQEALPNSEARGRGESEKPCPGPSAPYRQVRV